MYVRGESQKAGRRLSSVQRKRTFGPVRFASNVNVADVERVVPPSARGRRAQDRRHRRVDVPLAHVKTAGSSERVPSGATAWTANSCSPYGTFS